MKWFIRIICIFVVFAFIFPLSACNPSEAEVAYLEFSVDKTALRADNSDSIKLTAVAKDAEGKEVKNAS